jgi:peptide/nickel transport system substrate-binding protein
MKPPGIPSIELGANPAITVAAKKVRGYGLTGEYIRGSCTDLCFQS